MADSSGNVLAVGFSGSSNPNFKGLYFACSSVLLSLKKALDVMHEDVHNVKFACICIGLSGAGANNRAEIKRIFLKYFETFSIDCAKLKVYSDALIAWHGAFRGESGVVVLSGTGALTYGKVGSKEVSSANMKERVALLRGGGFHIGLYGAKFCLKDLNENRSDSVLLKIIQNAFESGALWKRYQGKRTLQEILEDAIRCFKREKMLLLAREDLASLAQYVDAAAEKGSPVARVILRGTATQVSTNISSVATLLDISGTNFKVAVVGSVINSFTVKWNLRQKLAIEEPFAELVEPLLPPEMGALDIAIRDLY
ncbi:hypothetical protein EXS74_03270 [Candidatus Woesearchaeota archaeon]|nr:hypothetical protein [Candidatus Woesearchaeota archaeon]